jgi:hypothetical protein
MLMAFHAEVQKLGGVSAALFQDKKGELMKRMAAQQDGSSPIGSNHQTREMTQGPARNMSGQGGRQQAVGASEPPSAEVLG